MNYEVERIIDCMERMLANNDADSAWYMHSSFAKIWNAQAPNSPEREAMAAVWKKMMIKWH